MASPPRYSTATHRVVSAELVSLVEEHTDRLMGVAFSILRDRGEAEDAVQETMLRAWNSWEKTKGHDDVGPWLTRICVNHCINRRQRLLRIFTGGVPESIGAAFDARDLDLDNAFLRLTLQQRAVVTLHYHYGHTLDESARLMGCRPGTARSHLARALATLREEVGNVE